MRRVALAAALALPLAAGAHEVEHEVVRGRAVAVRAWYAGGEPLAYAEYQLFAPSDPRVPFQKGRTDRAGWVAFVPSEAGRWRVKIADASGHGLELAVSADPEAAAPAAPPPPPSRTLRSLAGVAVIGLAFAALFAVHRLRRRSR
jgi:nickel transport protein